MWFAPRCGVGLNALLGAGPPLEYTGKRETNDATNVRCKNWQVRRLVRDCTITPHVRIPRRFKHNPGQDSTDRKRQARKRELEARRGNVGNHNDRQSRTEARTWDMPKAKSIRDNGAGQARQEERTHHSK